MLRSKTFYRLPYFYGYKTVFSFQNNHKNLDPSLDPIHLNCLERLETRIIVKFHRSDLVIYSRFREWKTNLITE